MSARSRLRTGVAVAAVALAVAAVSCGSVPRRIDGAARPPAGAGPQRPALVILIVVDQLRGDLLSRAAGHLDPSGGFARLLAEGRVFDDAHQDHAITETAPGHATVSTGVPPSVHGILGNSWYDRSAGGIVGCVEDPAHPSTGGGPGVSPRHLKTTTLGDWMKDSFAGSRVVAVGGKDRSAVLLAGRSADAVFWYSPLQGRFVTSRFWSEPALLELFTTRRPVASFACRSWERIDGPVDIPIADPDDAPWEQGGVFPHDLPCPEETDGNGTSSSEQMDTEWRRLFSVFRATPFADELLLDLAADAVDEFGLGRDDEPDLLAVAPAATDSIGHRYGPESQEALDQIRRLDRALGRFLTRVEEAVGGPGRMLVVLTGDHGVVSLPERDDDPATVRHSGSALARRVGGAMTARFGEGSWILSQSSSHVYLPRPVESGQGHSSDEIERAAIEALSAEPAIARVYARSDLAPSSEPGRGDPHLPLMRASWSPDRGGDLMVRIREGCLVTDYPTGTTHGTPYRYDTHVALIVRGPGIAPGRSAGRVSVRQIAPTVAARLGMDVPPHVEAPCLPDTGECAPSPAR